MPESLKKTLTYDRGKEMADHKKFTTSTKMQIFFCDPNSQWQSGFFPKGTDFNEITNQKISWVQEALNERPRQPLDFKTPNEAMNLLLLHQ
jgi:IS30 family transposase